MEISGHLSEKELAEIVLSLPPAISSHLERCDKCLDEVIRLRDWVGELRDLGEEGAEFWANQQRAIRSKLPPVNSTRDSKSARFAWAMAAATIAVATVLVVGGRPPEPEIAPQARVDPDHELLLEVERSLQTGGPEALEPAALLAREIGQQTVSNAASRRQKETPHEN
jgi:hypothetical protein